MRIILKRVKKWLEKADRDLKSAVILFNNQIYDYSLFHSQQAVEKYLKAFLTFHNKLFGKTHNIGRLLKLCEDIDKDFLKLEEFEVLELYPKAVEVRYPTSYIPSREEAEEAIKIAKKVRDFVKSKVLKGE